MATRINYHPLPVIFAYWSIGIGFLRVQVVRVARSSVDPLCQMFPPSSTATEARSSNTSQRKTVGTGNTKSESGTPGAMAKGVNSISNSWFLDPCQTSTEETTLSITHWSVLKPHLRGCTLSPQGVVLMLVP